MPGNRVFDVVVFEGPDVLAEFGGVSVFFRLYCIEAMVKIILIKSPDE